MNKDVSMIRDAYGARGYIFADVQADPRFLEEPGTLDLVYNVKEGDRYRISRINIHIEGDNPHTRSNTVLNRLSIWPGEVIDLTKLRQSERRLKASNLFMSDPTKGAVPKIVFSPPEGEDDEEEQVVRKPKKGGRGGNFRGQSPDGDAPATDGAAEEDGDTPWKQIEFELERVPDGEPYRQPQSIPVRVISGNAPPSLMLWDGPVAPKAETAVKPAGGSGFFSVPDDLPDGAANGPATNDGNTGGNSGSNANGNGGSPVTWRAVPAQRGLVASLNAPNPNFGPPPPAAFTKPAPQPAKTSAKAKVGDSKSAVPYTNYSTVKNTTPVWYDGFWPRSLLDHGPADDNGGVVFRGQSYDPQGPTPVDPNGPPPPAYNPATPPRTGIFGGLFNRGNPPPPQQLPPGTLPPGMMPPGGVVAPGVPGNPPILGQPVTPDGAGPPVAEPPDRFIPVDVFTKETQTGRFQFGAGVNSNAGLIGNIVIDEQNFDWRRIPTSSEDWRNGTAFRGAGQRFRIQLSPGTQLQSYSVSFQEPYLFDTLVNFGVSGSYFQRYYRDWTETRAGGRVSLGYQFTPDLGGNVSFRGENVNI